jgi:hypothetical protein
LPTNWQASAAPGKSKSRGELEDFVGFGFFRPDQLVKFRKILPVNLRLVKWLRQDGGREIPRSSQSPACKRPAAALHFHRTENNNRTRLGVAAFAVATARGLNDRVQRPKRAERDGEIHVHTGFDELGGNEPARLT